jgi:hypothetical protein
VAGHIMMKSRDFCPMELWGGIRHDLRHCEVQYEAPACHSLGARCRPLATLLGLLMISIVAQMGRSRIEWSGSVRLTSQKELCGYRADALANRKAR